MRLRHPKRFTIKPGMWDIYQHVKSGKTKGISFLPTLLSFDALIRGLPHWNIAIMFGVEKLECCSNLLVKNNLKICSFFSTDYTNVPDGRMDRTTS